MNFGSVLSSTMKQLLVFLLLSAIAGVLAFETCSSEQCEDSCKNRCGDKPNNRDYTCQCNSHCERFGDCCKDYSICNYIDPDLNKATHYDKSDTSCQGRCGQKYKKNDHCHCNKKCGKFNNCCSDYDNVCSGGASASTSTSSASDSHHKHIDSDLNEVAHHDKADIDPNLNKATHYDKSVNDISNEEIKTISEKLYQCDVNKAAESDIILNKQEMVSRTRNNEDLSDEPLYQHVNENIFKRPTFARFISLLDNYDRKTGTDETYTPEEIKEQNNFLQEIMKTKVMKELYSFFHQKGLYKTEKEFVDDLQKMWFGLYSRSSGEPDSSGFEHVFVGEVKKGQVSGFHSWIRFYLLEKKGMMNYHSHNFDGPWTSYPDVLGKQFNWDGFNKEVGTQFIGSSPEFDFAIYTMCFISRPGKKCQISLEGHNIGIQTYTWTKTSYDNGKKYIATAYPVV
ncbi:uridylate-specific endoribonuclease isoform X2 [Mixophyes fleayi]|uniref:uridylate-specific endoribonuclease isoform X2 n=1 Tax=Mixophyes fleayi TaxID=3061075 RepID=UPI003F4E0F59